MLAVAGLLWAWALQAAHIIGGEITYTCLGNDTYRFTMKIYRDCAGGGAQFDSAPNSNSLPGTVTVFHGTSIYTIITLQAPVVTSIQPEISNPCLVVPPGICVEEGVYTFTLTLPKSNQSYTVSYQRCCRNNTITNIVDPGNVGATYTIELTPEAQQVCNSSPSFNNFPPIVICAGEDIDFDFSATDPDGDQLVYEFCAPFKGGGPNTGQPTLPTGVAPDPDLPPPYIPVNFISPPYTPLNPMGGDPQVTIDPNTGLITGVPTTLGQFVVGVCVSEYRNGELLSVLRRDFQFNVTTCDPTVVADIAEDTTVVKQGRTFSVVNACGATQVTIDNTSYQQQYIENVYWEFFIDGAWQTINQWDATVSLPGIGSYDGQLILNPNTDCGDTAYVQINVFPSIEADFTYDYDTCMAGPVQFTDLSSSDAGPGSIVQWQWQFGDGGGSTARHPSYTYPEPGYHDVSLTVTDTNSCSATTTRTISYFPVPRTLIVSPTTFNGCQPAEIFFDNLSSPINEEYDIWWEFGDGGTSTEISPVYVYQDTGVFTISLSVVSPLGCETDTVFYDWIRVRPSPTADFTYSPTIVSRFEPTVTFTDQSRDAVKWEWFFPDGTVATLPDVVHTFPDTGMQEVMLVVTHLSGCTDTARAFIDVIPDIRFFLPNAFSPNYDGVNDFFRGAGVLDGVQDFHLSIWNRWGELIFETTDPTESWNGRKQNTGAEAPPGIYVVVATMRSPRGEQLEFRGFVTLVR